MNLQAYDEIKLSTFSSNARILQKHISLASCCLGMELHEEGMDKINRANDVSVNAEEVKWVKTALSSNYLETFVNKALP